MADEGEVEAYECPNCNSPVEPSWKACPNCGVEFAADEEAPAPEAAGPPPAAPERPASALAAPPPPPVRAPPAQAPARSAPPKSAAAKATAEVPSAKKARGGLVGRMGMIGLLGILVLVLGLVGFVVTMNWDTLIAGQAENTIGPNQVNAMIGAAAVAGAGAVITFLGLVRARPMATGRQMAEISPESAAPVPEVVVEEAPEPAAAARAPSREAPPAEISWPAVERSAPPPAVAASAPAARPAAATAAVVEDEEEEGEFELPGAGETAALRAPEPEAPSSAAAMAPPSAAPAAAPPVKDELEDLFGELESEVAAADDEDIHYECPNCHGIVKEDDTTCPHCQVVFEG